MLTTKNVKRTDVNQREPNQQSWMFGLAVSIPMSTLWKLMVRMGFLEVEKQPALVPGNFD